MIAEVLFALIVDDIKRTVEKDYFLTKTSVAVPEEMVENTMFVSRLKIAFQAIGWKDINIEDVDYDYDMQGDMLQEILQKNFF